MRNKGLWTACVAVGAWAAFAAGACAEGQDIKIRLHGVVFDDAKGAEVWRADIGAPVYAAPVATGNTLFVADWGGTVYAFAGR